MAASSRQTQVSRVLIITLVLNLIVMMLKFVLGFWTGSLSLIADALHSVTDSVNNVLGLVTNHLSSPEPDRDHPYGHQKFEAIGALGIAAFLGIACFEILQGVIERLSKPGEPVHVSAPELFMLLIVLGINILVAFYEREVGYRIQSQILIADAQHTMSDIWVTIAVLGGLVGIWIWQIQWLDILLAVPVMLMVAWSCWQVLQMNLPWLVDEIAIAPETIHRSVMEVPGVVNCHSIASRGLLGHQVFIEMHLVVAATDIETAHQITETVEKHLEAKYGPVRVITHVEPPDYESSQISY